MEEILISEEDKKRLVVGYKQVSKAKKNGICVKIFVAADSSSNIIDSLTDDENIEIVSVPTMRELGNACEIDVPSSCAAIIRL